MSLFFFSFVVGLTYKKRAAVKGRAEWRVREYELISFCSFGNEGMREKREVMREQKQVRLNEGEEKTKRYGVYKSSLKEGWGGEGREGREIGGKGCQVGGL